MSDQELSRIRIVLVEPAGALNVGAIARVMKNMGLSQLVLVNPQCDRLSADACKMAVHASEILQQAQIVATLPDALAGCGWAIATAGRTHLAEVMVEPPRTVFPWLVNALRQQPAWDAALIFGREDHGLSNHELKYAQRFVCIPSNPAYVSLNLAQAVGICGYELYLATIASIEEMEEMQEMQEMREMAPLQVLEGYFQDLEALLLQIEYVYPHTCESRMKKLRRLFDRATLSTQEVTMLRGMLRQMRWALRQNSDSELDAQILAAEPSNREGLR
jgi:tRNA/rRNA methyltransferase